MIQIRQATEKELNLVLDVELDAFEGDPEIRTLVTDLAADESARPLISLLAFDGELAVGHVYFSRARVEGGNLDDGVMILAPLAVRTSYQKKGIGQQLINAGFEYAYQYPGINRVLQAAGRVIRTENDRGVVLLIDQRYATHRYRSLFPLEWQPIRVQDQKQFSEKLKEFWSQIK